MANPAPAVQPADRRAYRAILDHHAELRRQLAVRLGGVRAAMAARGAYQPQLAELVTFIDDQVLPHAAAEEATLYRAAAADPRAVLLVDAMSAEHRSLARRARALAAAETALEALGAAEAFAAVFALHVDKENELLLPAVLNRPGSSLAAVLAAMRQRLAEPVGVGALPRQGGAGV